MREGRSAVCSLAKFMYCLRNVGKEPGRFASSTRSCADNSLDSRRPVLRGLSGIVLISAAAPVVEYDTNGGADGAEGWDMAFWPVMTVPSCRPAEIWCEKLELIAGMTWTFFGMPVMAPRR